MRRRFVWTLKQTERLEQVQAILEELSDYKPLTLRQVYYQLVGKGFIENKVSQYGALSKLLKWARIDGHVAWKDIEDRVRRFDNATGWDDKEHFTEASLKHFLRDYRRDLLQGQKKYLEAWIEKDALSAIFGRICKPYCVSVVVCRGFSSVSFLNDFRQRLSLYEGRTPVMLYFGDFDPSGMEMLTSMQITLENEMDVEGVEFKRIALLKEDIGKYELPHNPNALKMTDTRAEKHRDRYGDLAVELDALRPDVLEKKIRDAVEAELDMDKYHEELNTQEWELGDLLGLKQDVKEFMAERD